MLSPLDKEVRKQLGTNEAYQRCMKLSYQLLQKIESGKSYEQSVKKTIKFLSKIPESEARAVSLILAASITRLHSEKKLQEWNFQDMMSEQQRELNDLEFSPRVPFLDIEKQTSE